MTILQARHKNESGAWQNVGPTLYPDDFTVKRCLARLVEEKNICGCSDQKFKNWVLFEEEDAGVDQELKSPLNDTVYRLVKQSRLRVEQAMLIGRRAREKAVLTRATETGHDLWSYCSRCGGGINSLRVPVSELNVCLVCGKDTTT